MGHVPPHPPPVPRPLPRPPGGVPRGGGPAGVGEGRGLAPARRRPRSGRTGRGGGARPLRPARGRPGRSRRRLRHGEVRRSAGATGADPFPRPGRAGAAGGGEPAHLRHHLRRRLRPPGLGDVAGRCVRLNAGAPGPGPVPVYEAWARKTATPPEESATTRSRRPSPLTSASVSPWAPALVVRLGTGCVSVGVPLSRSRATLLLLTTEMTRSSAWSPVTSPTARAAPLPAPGGVGPAIDW